MYSIKIMSAENLPDSDVGKGFKMITIGPNQSFEFGHDPTTGEPQVTISGYGEFDTVIYPLTGNAYVLSETGKTIASFWGRRKTVHVELDEHDPHPEKTIEFVRQALLKSADGSHPGNQVKITYSGHPKLADTRITLDRNYLTIDGVSTKMNVSVGGLPNLTSPIEVMKDTIRKAVSGISGVE